MPTSSDPTNTTQWIVEHDPLPIVTFDDGRPGFDARSAYVETYWLAVLGPSSILTLRRLTDWLDEQPTGLQVNQQDLAASLGLGAGLGRHAPLVRTLDRLVKFGAACVAWDAYAVRRTMPPLAERHIRRLPGYLAERHAHDVAATGMVATEPLDRMSA